MRVLYVVTHPEATHHVERLVGGWYDSSLTPAGSRAADAVGAALRAELGADTEVELFSSDLLRTRQTAEAVGAVLHTEPVLDRRLRAKSYGEAEGRPQEWLDQRFVPPPAVGERMRHDEGLPGAETRADIALRVYAAMDAILERRCAHQVVVTHGFAATVVVAWWIGMPIESLGYVDFRIGSGSITTLRDTAEGLANPAAGRPRANRKILRMPRPVDGFVDRAC